MLIENKGEVQQDNQNQGEVAIGQQDNQITDQHDDSSHEVHDEVEEPEEITNEENEPELRRSERVRKPPDYYGVWINTVDNQFSEPKNIKDALESSNKHMWKEAMQKEMDSLHANKVWELVPLPRNKRVIGSKWVFTRKAGPNGSVERFKARLVAQGYSQKFGLDYDETFSPLVRFESIRSVIALAAENNLKLHQMDVTTAFLNGELEEEVYMRQPEGFVSQGQGDLVCKLKRSMYGLKQFPRCWNHALNTQLKAMGFQQDPCLYVNTIGELFIVAVYVDDILLACKSDEKMQEMKKALGKRFVKDMGELCYFLGIKIVQNKDNGSIWIGQPTYTKSVLEKFNMDQAKAMKTPVNISQKLVQALEDSECVDSELYQSAVGSLLHLSTRTRPDIAYAVSNVAKFCSKPIG